MKRTKLLLLLLTLLVASALVLSACGGGATEEPMEEEPMQKNPLLKNQKKTPAKASWLKRLPPRLLSWKKVCFQRSPHAG